MKRGDDWASTKRFTSSAGNTTRVTRGENGGMINRRGEGFVGRQGENIYAGRDGNAYRRDQNGNWSKWDNGNWNQVQKPGDGVSTRDKMLNDKARQRERQSGNMASQRDTARGERTGQPASRPTQMDRGTFNTLQRDMGARREGAQRSRDFSTYSNRGGNAGSYRGGGMSRGGGGFRGGGRRGR